MLSQRQEDLEKIKQLTIQLEVARTRLQLGAALIRQTLKDRKENETLISAMFEACGDQNSNVFGGISNKNQASEPGSNTAQNVPKQVAPKQRTFKTNKLAKKIQDQIKEYDEVETANAGGNI